MILLISASQVPRITGLSHQPEFLPNTYFLLWELGIDKEETTRMFPTRPKIRSEYLFL
jgi:hypothetical protein